MRRSLPPRRRRRGRPRAAPGHLQPLHQRFQPAGSRQRRNHLCAGARSATARAAAAPLCRLAPWPALAYPPHPAAPPPPRQAESRAQARSGGLPHPAQRLLVRSGDLYPAGRNYVATLNAQQAAGGAKAAGGPAGLPMNTWGVVAVAATDTERARCGWVAVEGVAGRVWSPPPSWLDRSADHTPPCCTASPLGFSWPPQGRVCKRRLCNQS
jgi:hypothetical protein